MLTKINFFVILNLTVLLLAAAAPASASYTVTLNNGEQLQAEGYKIEGENITLRFRQGSAAFPKKLVRSVSGFGAPDMSGFAQQPQQPDAEPIGGQPSAYAPPLTADPQADENPDDASYINEGDGGETQ